MSFKFEKLAVWKKALDLSCEIHITTRRFPKEELYMLTSQMKRAADSIGLNIAEGSTGQSNLEFKKFLGYSIRSAVEDVGCLYLAKKRNLINTSQFTDLYEKVNELTKKVQALKKSIH